MKHRLAQLALTVAVGALASACASAPSARPREASSYANYLVGHLANSRSDHQAASDRLYRALMSSPGDATLMDGALTAALATGDIERARAIGRMNVARGQEAPAYHSVVRGVEALNAGRWRQAREYFANARGDTASELTARMALAWARTGEGHVDEIAVELSRLSNMRPYGGLFAYQQAMALDFAGRSADAKVAYGTAERGGLFLPPGVERHADLLARIGDREGALAILRGDGRGGNPALAAAAARVEAGQPAASQPLNASRGAAVGLYGLAAIFGQENDATHALATLTLANMLDPNLDAARISFAEQQAQLRHPDEARAALARVPANSPYAETAKLMESWVLVQEGRPDDGLALAQQNARSGTPRARRALADMYRTLERYSEADPIYTSLIEAQPAGEGGDWRIYFQRGVVRQSLNRWPEAEADLRRALQLSPNQPEVLNYLGYTWVDRGENLQQGLDMIQRAAALRPMSGAIIDSLGWAYYRLGRYDLALDNLERAVELSPADPVLNDHLGDVYWRTNRRTEARFQWRRALTLEPTSADRTLIEQKIERGLPAPQSARR